jgi:predicted lipoprotein with Yx(FWY)xxD motif
MHGASSGHLVTFGNLIFNDNCYRGKDRAELGVKASEDNCAAQWFPMVQLSVRDTVLGDISPIASTRP